MVSFGHRSASSSEILVFTRVIHWGHSIGDQSDRLEFISNNTFSLVSKGAVGAAAPKANFVRDPVIHVPTMLRDARMSAMRAAGAASGRRGQRRLRAETVNHLRH